MVTIPTAKTALERIRLATESGKVPNVEDIQTLIAHLADSYQTLRPAICEMEKFSKRFRILALDRARANLERLMGDRPPAGALVPGARS
jgi:hypothetical protein